MGAITRLTKNVHLPPPLVVGSASARPQPTAASAPASTAQNTAVDVKLLLAAQRGDKAAFVAIVERHQGAVYGYLRGRLFEPADAEDLCQEVFLRCFTVKARFDESAMVRPWLIGVARNVLREHIRKITRRHEVVWTELCLELETMVQTDDSLYDDVLGHLPACLESLGPSARQALDLHYASRLKLTDISQRLKRSVGAVKLLMHRSRLALRRCLNGKVARESH